MTATIAPLSSVPEDSTVLFRVRDADGDRREAILVRPSGGDGPDADSAPVPPVLAWLNECQHFTHVPLDKGSGAPVRGDEVVCANHGAMFELATGRCTHGPCEGAFLTSVDVEVCDGAVRLADDDYAYLGRGPLDDGTDLTSTSNVEF